jgi:hypothetical protein
MRSEDTELRDRILNRLDRLTEGASPALRRRAARAAPSPEEHEAGGALDARFEIPATAAPAGGAEEKSLGDELRLLKADIELMIKREGRRSFWAGVWTNAVFFVIGLVTSAVSLSSTQVFALFGLK